MSPSSLSVRQCHMRSVLELRQFDDVKYPARRYGPAARALVIGVGARLEQDDIAFSVLVFADREPCPAGPDRRRYAVNAAAVGGPSADIIGRAVEDRPAAADLHDGEGG